MFGMEEEEEVATVGCGRLSQGVGGDMDVSLRLKTLVEDAGDTGGDSVSLRLSNGMVTEWRRRTRITNNRAEAKKARQTGCTMETEEEDVRRMESTKKMGEKRKRKGGIYKCIENGGVNL